MGAVLVRCWHGSSTVQMYLQRAILGLQNSVSNEAFLDSYQQSTLDLADSSNFYIRPRWGAVRTGKPNRS